MPLNRRGMRYNIVTLIVLSISNCDIHKYPDLMDKFKWDGSGRELGLLKDESEELVEKHFMKKIRKQNKYKDTGKTLPEHKQEIKDLYAICRRTDGSTVQ